MWAMAGISGYVYDFEVEGGLGTKGPPNGCYPPNSCGESGFVVLRLAKDLEPGKHQLFFGNYFASPELVDYLGVKRKIWALSTLNTNRSRGCPIPTEYGMTTNVYLCFLTILVKILLIHVKGLNGKQRKKLMLTDQHP